MEVFTIKANYKNIEKKYLFSNICKKDFVILGLYAIISFLLYLINKTNILTLISSIGIIYFCFKKTNISLSLFIITEKFLINNAILKIALLVIILLFLTIKTKFKIKDIIYMALITIIVGISVLIGKDVNTTTALLLLISIYSFFAIKGYFRLNDISSLVYAYFLTAICLCGVVLANYFIQGTSTLLYGRLNFDGDIKGLAIQMGIPLVIIITTRINGIKIFNLKINKIIVIILFFFLGITIILTSARGVILSIVLVTIFSYLLSKHKYKNNKYIITILIIIFGISLLGVNIDGFRLNRILQFEEYFSGNGRTEIWMRYITIMKESGLKYIIFGMGPGEISRISNIGYYAHSTFLDFFFSYGILGFIYIVSFEIMNFKNFINRKNYILICLFLFIIIAYISHGSSSNIAMFMFQGVLMGMPLSIEGVETNE